MAKIELGKRFNELPKATPNNNKFHEIDSRVDLAKPKSEVIAELGFTQKQVERFQQMAKNPDAVQKAIDDAQATRFRNSSRREILKCEIDCNKLQMTETILPR